MKNRHTPIKECDFIKIIEPHMIKYYQRPGLPGRCSVTLCYRFFSKFQAVR